MTTAKSSHQYSNPTMLACHRTLANPISQSFFVATFAVCCLTDSLFPVTQAADPIARQGQVFWLEATTINNLREREGLPALQPGDAVDHWPDKSGNKRHFQQSEQASKPTLTQTGDFLTVRFDGQTDHLRHLQQPTTIDKATIFFVVAPHDNPGDFRGFLSAGSLDGRDYETGFNIDLGPGPTRRFEQINVEGRGFGGARDLLDGSFPFGDLVLLHYTIDPDSRLITAFIENKVVGSRSFDPAKLSVEHLTLGARFYTNGPGAQQVRGPVKADFAEVVMYDRVLANEEQTEIVEHLKTKYAKLRDELPQSLKLEVLGTPLVKVPNPPEIQMLVPGFEVTELPVQLTNVNNVRFRDDGKLITLGYNGDIHLLHDSDGDGIEDKAAIYFKNEGQLRGPIGLQWTPDTDPRGQGAFVPSKGKVSFIIDRDGDDRADEERVIASGWNEIPQNVDAVGIAMDREGALYFGLGTANYANAFLLDDEGKAAFDLQSDRGTIQRIAPDLSSRTTICTGVRFPVALAFTKENELFCTDQEGATWLPNGNPFDELLHIRQGLHYGFPPRHPIHNPDVIDEPSTYDFAPQHQSTCGLVFNGVAGQTSLFGPTWWENDAIICGESRGKLWRVSLGKTPYGYVATSQLIAALQMLTIDACVAPNGDLVVACHSGPPDWGTGPGGIGKLFRIRKLPQQVARPVAVWASSEREIRVSFDAPIPTHTIASLRNSLTLEAGKYVRAGDRYENLVPPYAVVQRQLVAPRFAQKIHSVSVTPDLRTLIVTTDPMNQREFHYSLTFAHSPATSPGEQERQSDNSFEVDFALCGVQARWDLPLESQASTSPTENASDVPATSNAHCWLPHMDLEIAQQWTQPSVEHRQFWDNLGKFKTLTLTTQVDCAHLLQPRIQPGSSLDYTLKPENPSLVLTSTVPFSGMLAETAFTGKLEEVDRSATSVAPHNSVPYYKATLAIADPGKLARLEVSLQCNGDLKPEFHIGFFTAEDQSIRPLGPDRFVLPWVPTDTTLINENAPRATIAELKDGNWGRGRRLFRSETIGCAKCHQIEGEGAQIGPSLANLIHRDYASVLRDIQHPSFAINPDYIQHSLLLQDGRVLQGVIRSDSDWLIVGDAQGRETRLKQTDVERMAPMTLSAMPSGLVDKLTTDELRDLMTYLLSPPPQMPLESPLQAPPIRTLQEVQQALANSAPITDTLKPIEIVLVAGPKDHGPGEHDYPAWQIQWAQLLAAAPKVSVSLAWEFPSDKQLESANVLIFFQKGNYDDTRSQKLDAFQERGGGLVLIHWAVNGNARASEFAKHIGLASHGGSIRYRHGPLKLDLHSRTHPILRNLETLELYDESYWLLSGEPEKITLLASSVEEGESRPQVWTYEKGPGRVFVSIPGHYSWTFDDALFRILLLRGIAWSADEPTDRFNEIVPLGARIRR